MDTNGQLVAEPRITPLAMQACEEVATKKIAIVAKAPSSKDLAPFTDPTWEIWVIGDMPLQNMAPRWDRCFEIHDLNDGFKRWAPQYVEWLKKDHGKPVYTQGLREDVPCSVPFPKDSVLDAFDKYIQSDGSNPVRYFTNTVSWMLALAIYEGATEIALYGVDMAQHGVGLRSEYAYQRPSVELWLGIAAGRGIRVTVPESCDLLKTPHMYGWDSQCNSMRLKFKPRMEDIRSSKKKAAENATKAQFEINRMKYHLDHWEARLTGVVGIGEEADRQRAAILENCAQLSAAIKNQEDALRVHVDRQNAMAGAEDDMMYWHQHAFG